MMMTAVQDQLKNNNKKQVTLEQWLRYYTVGVAGPFYISSLWPPLLLVLMFFGCLFVKTPRNADGGPLAT